MATLAPVSQRVEEPRYLALLRAANAIATCSDCAAASETLSSHMREVTPFDFLHLVAFNTDTNTPDWCVRDIQGKTTHGADCDALRVQDSPIEWVHESGQPLVTNDWSEEKRFKAYASHLAEVRIAATCAVPLTRGARRLGVLVLGRFYPYAYDEEDPTVER